MEQWSSGAVEQWSSGAVEKLKGLKLKAVGDITKSYAPQGITRSSLRAQAIGL